MSGRPLLLDLGRPLTEGPGLEERYVGLYPDAEASLTEWLAALPGESTPRRATVFGQLGIGKTTLIRRCMAHAGPDCDVSFNLASGPWSPLPGIVCLDVVTAIARRLGGELPAAAEACLCGPGGLWEGLPAERTAVRLEDLFRPERLTPAVEEDRRQVDDWVQRYPDAVADATKSAVQGLGTHLGRIPLLVIEGLDVLGRRSAWYLGVRMVLTAATGWEAHLLMETGWGLGSDVGQPWQREVDERVLLVVAPDHGPGMNALLDARAGGHARYLASAQDDFAALSGGLPRQALRLQYEYLVGRERLRLPAPRALGRAARRARDVLLAPPLGGFDSELLRAIRRQGGVRGEPGDEAVLRTWAIITDRAGHDGLVPARLNPLLEEMLGAPREPRDATLGIWERAAAAEGMSPAGVGPGPGQQDTAALVQHLRDVGVMQEPYGVLEAFEALRDVLLPPVGVGLAVVLYEQEEAARIAADAVLGLHAAEEEPPVQHREVSSLTELRGLPWTRLRREGLSLLLLQAAGTGPTYAREAVLTLEAHRNHLLVDVDRCLLWLPVEWAQAFLQHGHHLRPFVSFLMLEQEVLEGVSTEDLRYDLEHLEDRAENGTPEAEARDRLRQVVEELLRREGT